MNMNSIRFVLYLLILSLRLQIQTTFSDNFTNGTLLFQSGFESDCTVIPQNNEADIIGTDRSYLSQTIGKRS
jgi:hypothetical protein